MPETCKILFIPVSTERGIGEYMRCRIIADRILATWPRCEIQFVLNRHSPIAGSTPYKTHLLDDTPTKLPADVDTVLASERPSIVIFDCSGRASNVRSARKLGIHTVFVSQHPRKRRRGFSLRRMPYLNQHWITQVRAVDGELGLMERLKCFFLPSTEPVFVGPVFDDSALQEPNVAELEEGKYVFYSAGGGGYLVDGRPSSEILFEAADRVYRETGMKGLVVAGQNFAGTLDNSEGVTSVTSLDNSDFIAALGQSACAVVSGGDVLAQACALHKRVVAVAAASDQPARIERYARKGLIRPSAFDAESVVGSVSELLGPGGESIDTAMRDANVCNGLDVAIDALARLGAKD